MAEMGASPPPPEADNKNKECDSVPSGSNGSELEEVEPAASTLKELYGERAFPASELVPGLPLSRIIVACWPEQDPKVGVSESLHYTSSPSRSVYV
jgi:hypothetical protein